MRESAISSEASNTGRPSIRRHLWQFVTVSATTWVAAALALAAILSPWLAAHGYRIAALAVAAFFGKLCHQQPERSFLLFGAPVAICVRCLGIYAGAALGSLLRLSYRTSICCLSVALALNGLDVAAETAGLHGNMPLSRLLIGGTLGVAVGTIFSLRHPTAESAAC